jgi:cobalt-zinc-cadmium efflux system protein
MGHNHSHQHISTSAHHSPHSHHSHNAHNISDAFVIGILINIVFIGIEVFYGLVSNSVALLADAGHNFSDVITLLFSWFAILLSRLKPNFRFTYGLRRTTILSALLNTILLLSAVGFIIYEAIGRFRESAAIQSNTVIIVASAGIFVNGITAWLFLKGKDKDLNVRSAFVHFIADTFVSFGVVVGGIVIAFTGINMVDPIVSLCVAGFILYNSYDLLIDSVNLALDAVPKSIDLSLIQDYLLSHKEVKAIHDLHVWALSTSETALTVHLVTEDKLDNNFITPLTDYLQKTFNIGHCTIQVEQDGFDPCETPCN